MKVVEVGESHYLELIPVSGIHTPQHGVEVERKWKRKRLYAQGKFVQLQTK